MTWTAAQWAGLGVRFDGEPMSVEEMAYDEDDYNEEEEAPMTADEKFLTLRATGYIGPIDQAGNAVTDGPVADILDSLRETL